MGIWERDLRTEVNTWDERLREILGVPREGVVDVQAWFFDRVPGEQRAQIEAFVAAAEKGGPGYLYECQYQRPDGHWIWISMSGGPRVDENGVPTHLAGLTADITARKEAEAEFVRLTAELDQRVADRTRDLADSRRRLRALLGELTRAEERERRRLAARAARHADADADAQPHERQPRQPATGRRRRPHARDRGAEPDAGDAGLVDRLHAHADRRAEPARALRLRPGGGAAVARRPDASPRPAGHHRRRPRLPELRDDQAVLVFQSVRELLWNVVKHAESPRADVTWQVELGELRVSVEDAGRGFSDVGSAQGGGFGLLSIRERVACRAAGSTSGRSAARAPG